MGNNSWMTRPRNALPFILALSAASCAPYRVRTDFDPEVAYSGLRTYSWVDSTRVIGDEDLNPFLDRRIRRAVDRVLSDRGFTAESPERADFLVTALVVTPTRPRYAGARIMTSWCGSGGSLHLAIGYPYGLSIRRPWYWFRRPYVRHPWGYSCAYRVGMGFVWLPVYEEPDGRMPGTVVIDVLDRTTHELIWRGWAPGALLDTDPAPPQEEIDAIVAKVLAEFPPPAAGR